MTLSFTQQQEVLRHCVEQTWQFNFPQQSLKGEKHCSAFFAKSYYSTFAARMQAGGKCTKLQVGMFWNISQH